MMASDSPRSHVKRDSKIPSVRADLIDIARRGYPGTQRDSFSSSGVNANNAEDSSLSSSQAYRYHSRNLPTFPRSQQRSRLTVEVDHQSMQHPTQLRNDNVYPNRASSNLRGAQLSHAFSQRHDFQGQEPPLSASSSNGSLSSSSLGTTPLFGPESDSPSHTRTIPSSQMASSGLSEAGGYPERLTSKKGRDSLSHVYRNQQPALISPATGSIKNPQAVPPGSSSFSISRPPTDTGAGSNQYLSSDCRPPAENLNVNRLTSSPFQSMIGPRLIHRLPSSPSSRQRDAQNPSSHPLKPAMNESSQSYSDLTTRRHLEPRAGPSSAQSVVSGTPPTTQNEISEGGSAHDDSEPYDDNDVSQRAKESKNKGKAKGIDTDESVCLKRRMDDYPKDTRKGTVGGPRVPSACDACKASKVRCVFPDRTGAEELQNAMTTHLSSYSLYNDSTSSNMLFKCERCLQGGLECHVSGRKKRDPPPSQDELEQKNDHFSERLLELLFERISLSRNALPGNARSSAREPKHRTETLLTSSTSMPPSMLPSTHAFMPQLPSSTPRYPGSSNAYPRSDQSLHVPNYARLVRPPPIRLTDLPPLPVLEKATSRAERELKVDKWIADATERLIKQGYAHTAPTVSSQSREGDESNHSQWESGTQVQNERVYRKADGNPSTFKADIVEEAEGIVENGDYVLDNNQILSATRAYIFGERTSTSFEDIPQKRLPPIISKNVITFADGMKLFDIFFDKINMFFSVCDPAIHTFPRVLRTSTFLFTTICAVASKHYSERPDLYPILLDYAKDAAGQAVNGPKTVEVTQAYLILGVYLPPSQTFKADRAYLFFGLAIRNATDIELYRPQYTYEPHPDMPEDQARKILNRGRTWLNCFCNDRSVSTQMGKPTAILIHGPAIPFNLKTWWRCSKWNLPSDIHMCAYADLLSVMADFHDVVYLDAYSADGRKKPLNLDLVQDYADKVSTVTQTWSDIIVSHFPNRTDVKLAWRDNLWPFIGYYAKLVVLSIGLRDGVRQGLTDKNPFSEQSIAAACALLTQVLDKLAKLGYMRYCVEAYFVFMGFAAAFLLKILRRKFSFMRKPGLEEKIISLVQGLIDLLGSDEVAIDNRHTPKLYSRFLADILAQHKRTHINRRLPADRDDDTLSSYAREVPQGERIVQENPSIGVDTQPMEDIQTYLHSQDVLQPPEYSDPRLNPAFSGYAMSENASPSMDLDIPLPPSYTNTNSQDTLLSMMPLRDPTFWDHLGMPLVTNPDTWPQMVDMTYDTGAAGLFNPASAQFSYQDNQVQYQMYPAEIHSSTESGYRQYH